MVLIGIFFSGKESDQGEDVSSRMMPRRVCESHCLPLRTTPEHWLSYLCSDTKSASISEQTLPWGASFTWSGSLPAIREGVGSTSLLLQKESSLGPICSQTSPLANCACRGIDAFSRWRFTLIRGVLTWHQFETNIVFCWISGDSLHTHWKCCFVVCFFCRELDVGVVHVLFPADATLVPSSCQHADLFDDCSWQIQANCMPNEVQSKCDFCAIYQCCNLLCHVRKAFVRVHAFPGLHQFDEKIYSLSEHTKRERRKHLQNKRHPCPNTWRHPWPWQMALGNQAFKRQIKHDVWKRLNVASATRRVNVEIAILTRRGSDGWFQTSRLNSPRRMTRFPNERVVVFHKFVIVVGGASNRVWINEKIQETKEKHCNCLCEIWVANFIWGQDALLLKFSICALASFMTSTWRHVCRDYVTHME